MAFENGIKYCGDEDYYNIIVKVLKEADICEIVRQRVKEIIEDNTEIGKCLNHISERYNLDTELELRRFFIQFLKKLKKSDDIKDFLLLNFTYEFINNQKSREDCLTGLYRKENIEKKIEDSLESYRRGIESKFSILMIDIDFFKEINDTYGHLTGDKILKQIGIILKESIREIDTAFRFGGDEFLILLKGTSEQEAKEVGERIKERIKEKLKIMFGLKKDITCSIGIGTVKKEDKNAKDIIERADKALYNSKNNGRDMITNYGFQEK